VKHLISRKILKLLPLVLVSTALVTPAYPNTFHGLNTVLNRNLGSAPNPTSQDIRKNRQGLHYPVQSQMLNEEGTVGLKISLTEKGGIIDAVVENSSGFPRLDNAAIDYVMGNWQYNQTDKEGQPTPAIVRVNVTFDMP